MDVTFFAPESTLCPTVPLTQYLQMAQSSPSNRAWFALPWQNEQVVRLMSPQFENL